MEHLKSQGIMELSQDLGANRLSKQIQHFALGPFQWNVTLLVPEREETSIRRTYCPSSAQDTPTTPIDDMDLGVPENAAEVLFTESTAQYGLQSSQNPSKASFVWQDTWLRMDRRWHRSNKPSPSGCLWSNARYVPLGGVPVHDLAHSIQAASMLQSMAHLAHQIIVLNLHH